MRNMKSDGYISDMTKETIIKSFFESKKNANCILDLEKCLLSEEEKCVLSSLEITEELFAKIFDNNMLHECSEKDANDIKFRKWLLTRYNDFVSHLLSSLSHGNAEIQIKSLAVLMKFIQFEGKNPLIKVIPGEWFFPKLLFQKIIMEFLSDVLNQHRLIVKFKSYTSYDDIRLYALKAIGNILNEKQEVNDIFLNNCFYILNLCSQTSGDSTTFLSQEGIADPFVLRKKLFSKIFSRAWGSFLKYELPLPLLKKVLVVLPKRVMKHFQNPCVLTDFLTDLYNKGGLTSLLALSGLFELMQKYNVEYPDFYLKLYSLFDESIINGKFSPRFFYLSDLFLSSTHLPAYMVAAFVKKLARISLRAKTDSLLKLIPLIYNLLIKHPTLLFLIHRTDPKVLSEDPFDLAASDPAESKAMESSLWEIKTLQQHVNPEVSRKAKIVNLELPKVEFDLTSVLDISIDDVYQKERKRKFTEAPTAVQKPAKVKAWWILTDKSIS